MNYGGTPMTARRKQSLKSRRRKLHGSGALGYDQNGNRDPSYVPVPYATTPLPLPNPMPYDLPRMNQLADQLIAANVNTVDDVSDFFRLNIIDVTQLQGLINVLNVRGNIRIADLVRQYTTRHTQEGGKRSRRNSKSRRRKSRR